MLRAQVDSALSVSTEGFRAHLEVRNLTKFLSIRPSLSMDSENYVDADELDSCWVQMGASCLIALCVIYIDPHGNVINCYQMNYILSSVSHRASYLLATRGSGSN